MPLGLVPSNNQWEMKWFPSTNSSFASSNFSKGDLVMLRGNYEVSIMSSHASQPLGIAMSASLDSTPIRGVNMVMVALPLSGAKAYGDLDIGVTASAMSIGKKVTIALNAAQTSRGRFSFVSTVMGEASRFSAYAQVCGPIDTALSRIEVSFNAENAAFYSTSSVTFAS